MKQEEDKFPDKIFVKDNLTTIEKLLMAKTYINELKKEIKSLKFDKGVLQSEISELKHENNQIQEIKLLKEQNKSLTSQVENFTKQNKLSRGEKLQIKKNESVQKLKEKTQEQKKEIEKQLRDRNSLITQKIKLESLLEECSKFKEDKVLLAFMHDTANPINTTHGFINLIEKKLTPEQLEDEDMKKYLEYSRQKLRTLQSVLDDYYSKIKNNGI